MDEESQEKEIQKLKAVNKDLRNYLNPYRLKEVEQNNQKELLKLFIEEGGSFYMKVQENNSKNDLELSKIEVELSAKKLSSIERMDTKEKIYKGLLLMLCIVAVIVSAMFIEKAESIIPVLTLIIGLLFKSNSFTDFLKLLKGDNKSEDNN